MQTATGAGDNDLFATVAVSLLGNIVRNCKIGRHNGIEPDGVKFTINAVQYILGVPGANDFLYDSVDLARGENARVRAGVPKIGFPIVNYLLHCITSKIFFVLMDTLSCKHEVYRDIAIANLIILYHKLIKNAKFEL